MAAQAGIVGNPIAAIIDVQPGPGLVA